MKSVPLGAVFYHTDLGQNGVFHNYARQIVLVQYSGRSKHALPCTTNNRNDHIIKRFHEENSIMSGLFSQNNLPLCGMQGSNALLGKNQNQYTASRFSLSTSANFVVRERYAST